MIRYGLACEHGHEFEGWFGSSADYDAQSERGLIACPVCDSRAVAKQIMAPAVAGTKKTAVPDVSPQMRSMVMEAMGKVRAHVEHVFAGQKHRMGLVVRTIGIARATIKIGMANLVYNFQRLAWLEGRGAPA